MTSASENMTEYMILFSVLAELGKLDGNLPVPIPKYRNPAPIPNPAPMHAQERVMAAQCGILAYYLEESLGFIHPLPELFRKIEREPFAWSFDNSPGLATWDFSSPETIRASFLAKFTAGFDAWTDDYMRRWKHR
jgi:hypothetical protein